MAPGIGRTAARRLRSIGCVVGVLFVLLGLIAISTCGLLFVGSWCLIFMGGFLFLLSFLWDALANFLWLRRTAVGLLGVGSALFLALLIWMIYAGWFLPPDEGPYTVIVLGAKVEGDSPSLMLQRRLEVSRDVLLAHPDWPVIVTGGQGSDESRTEASVMAEWLIAQGIESSRIHLEDRSTNTAQNIEYAKAILEAEELPPRFR